MLMLASLAVQLPAEAASRMPVKLPISIKSGLAVVDFRPWLLETNDVDITRIYLCRRLGSQCYETVWDVNLPAGWRQPKIELLSVYSGANVSTFNPTALQARGSYNLDIAFNERSRWHPQTASNLYMEFCLSEASGVWNIQDNSACLARSNTERLQGSQQ